LETWIKTWAWGHHCVGVIDHGDCVYLHKNVLRCGICGTSQLKLLFDEIGIRDLE